MRINVQAGLFTQAAVLQIVPRLTAATLRNWASRGLIDSDDPPPGYGPHRRYTALGVIQLGFITELAALGIGPSDARELAHQVAAHALELHNTFPASEENGRLTWRAYSAAAGLYYRAYIVRREGKPQIIFRMQDPGAGRLVLPHFYIWVEVDLFALRMLDRIYAHVAGQPMPNDLAVTVAPEDRDQVERFATMMTAGSGS